MVGMQQVHGSRVVRVTKKDNGRIIEKCDALISNDSEVALYVRVADCLPILIVDQKSHSFGLIHAGWRGLDKGIIGKMVVAMKEKLKVKSENLKVKIGPHICQKHYEVKSDVSSKFVKCPQAVLQRDGKLFLDLAKIAELQLIGLGVKKENIKIDNKCTFEDSSLPSYRLNHTTKRAVYTLNPNLNTYTIYIM